MPHLAHYFTVLDHSILVPYSTPSTRTTAIRSLPAAPPADQIPPYFVYQRLARTLVVGYGVSHLGRPPAPRQLQGLT